jgi:ABC-2 type transport system permease protein
VIKKRGNAVKMDKEIKSSEGTTNSSNHASRFAHRVSRFAFQLNPIIIKEMRGQMRGSRAFWTLTGYLVGLGLLAYGLYRVTLANVNQRFGAGAPPQSAFIGQTLFSGLAFLEMLFVCFVTPALTAGAISGEVERRTYDTLLVTPLRSANVLWGKMVASLIYVQLLILAAIPLSSVVFLFGGVALRDVIQVIGLLALTAVTYGVLGLFFSALTRRTSQATVWSYLVVLMVMFGSVLTWAITGTIVGRTPPRELLYPSPISALASAIITPEMLRYVYQAGPAMNLLLLLGGGAEVLGMTSTPVVAATRPLWQYTAALYVAATVVLYLLTTQLVKPIRRWRIGWAGLAGVLSIVALLAGGLWFMFGTIHGSTGWRGQPQPTPPPPPGVVVERVVVEEIVPEVNVPPTPTPVPPPTPSVSPLPTPTPVPFDVGEHEATLRDYLEQNVFPEDETTFCDLDILESQDEIVDVRVFLWAYCRAFTLTDGELVPGLGISAPANVGMYWTPEKGWQVGGHWLGDLCDVFPPEVQERLLESPYDEAAGEERVLERARRILLGSESSND